MGTTTVLLGSAGMFEGIVREGPTVGATGGAGGVTGAAAAGPANPKIRNAGSRTIPAFKVIFFRVLITVFTFTSFLSTADIFDRHVFTSCRGPLPRCEG
jgi:hypothetical protein